MLITNMQNKNNNSTPVNEAKQLAENANCNYIPDYTSEVVSAKNAYTESVEQAAERLTIEHYKPSYLPAKPSEYNFYKGFMSGYAYRADPPHRE